MTYKQAYENCKTVEELRVEVGKDIRTAMWMNPDRIDVIIRVADEVSKLKGWELSVEGSYVDNG